ncbi:MAG TPA: RNA 2',3'-cyclic phosphodiesterase [Candidatus Bathyarchaeia archaeon]
MAMSEAIRSFIAFDLDDEAILRKIADVQRILAKTGADLKLVEPKNIHMTLRFLGNIMPSTVERIYAEMTKVQFTAFDVKISGVGAFPQLRYPRVLWVGITQGADQLRSIFDQLEPSLQTLGFAPDPKGFSPHLTIARVRSGRNREALVKCVGENANLEFGTIRAECLRLKSSDLTPRGPIYSTLKEFCQDK